MKPLVLLPIAALVIGACGKGDSRAADTSREVAGACQPVSGADVCTWARMSGSQLVTIGATVPIASIENSPAEAPMVWPPAAAAVIPLPAEVLAAAGVSHLTVYWEPHGHPPGAFMTPHFDFHFYSISDSARQAIDCASKTKPDTLPAGYAMADMDIPGIGLLIGLCVPQMGMHSLPSAVAQDTTLFSSALILGYYDGHPIFFEPMISRATLLERKSFGQPIPTPAGLGAGVHYPTQFEAVYDAAIPGYRIVFSGFSM